MTNEELKREDAANNKIDLSKEIEWKTIKPNKNRKTELEKKYYSRYSIKVD